MKFKNFEEFVQYVTSKEFNIARSEVNPNGKMHSRFDLEQQFNLIKNSKPAIPIYYLDQEYREPHSVIFEGNDEPTHFNGGTVVTIKCEWFTDSGELLKRVSNEDGVITFRTQDGKEVLLRL